MAQLSRWDSNALPDPSDLYEGFKSIPKRYAIDTAHHILPRVEPHVDDLQRALVGRHGASREAERCSKEWPRWSGTLVDDRVSSREQRREAECLRGLEINRQFELDRLLNRKIGWLSARQDLVHVDGSKSPHVLEVRLI